MCACGCVCVCLSLSVSLFVRDSYCSYRSIGVHIRADSVFTRVDGELEERVPAFFASRVFDVDSTRHLDINELIANLVSKVDNWNGRGSWYSVDHIMRFMIITTNHRPLCGSTYIPTPQWLANKNAVINVKNKDNRCFVWTILSAMHPGAHNSDMMSCYQKYDSEVNTSGLTFPLDVRDVPKFEALNPTISVNVLCTGDEGGYVPLHMS